MHCCWSPKPQSLRTDTLCAMRFELLRSHPSHSLGDGRYSLLGQPLQYNLSICPPLLHGQSTYTVHQVSLPPQS